MTIEGTIQTASGLYVNPLNVRVEDVRLEDIAHALGNQCRWAGHVREFYSVAEHSVRVAQLLADEAPEDLELQMRGLLHDASEAYLVDLPRPIKMDPDFGALYRKAEDIAQHTIMEAFALPGDEPEEVKLADIRLLATERRDLMTTDDQEWNVLRGVEPVEGVIIPLSPERARQLFVECALMLVSASRLRSSTPTVAEAAGRYYSCAECGKPTTAVNPPDPGEGEGATRYNLCVDCGGVESRA